MTRHRTIDHDRAVSLIVLTLLVLILLALWRPLLAQEHDVELQPAAVQSLLAYWQQPTADSMVCLFGHRRGPVVVIDSTSALTADCPGAFGAIGFLRDLPEQLDDVVIYSLILALSSGPEWQFIAEMRGVGAIPTSSGRMLQGPILLYAYRRVGARPFTKEGRL